MKNILNLAVILLWCFGASAQVTITTGGTYSWPVLESTAAGVPLITVSTDQPVTIVNSVLIGRGSLIVGTGTAGLNVTVRNNTGICYDPHSAGLQRGQFVNLRQVATLTADHNTLLGCSFGVQLQNSTSVTACAITNNTGSYAEDRASSGTGWVTASRPQLGHFIFLAAVSLPNGCDIGWNQFTDTVGRGSVEDVINLYEAQGSAAHPIAVHDNYVEGASSPPPSGYTGSCGIVDGTSTQLSAYTLWTNNLCVGGSGVGWAISNGHDNSMTNGRVVSCGHDAAGNWIMATFAQGVYIGNDYGQTTSTFLNNTMSGMSGGLLRPAGDGSILTTNSYKDSGLPASNTITGSNFTNPCLVSGQVSLAAEAAERTAWAAKVATAGQTIGDQHLL